MAITCNNACTHVIVCVCCEREALRCLKGVTSGEEKQSSAAACYV